jgi:hypothetical protein
VAVGSKRPVSGRALYRPFSDSNLAVCDADRLPQQFALGTLAHNLWPKSDGGSGGRVPLGTFRERHRSGADRNRLIYGGPIPSCRGRFLFSEDGKEFCGPRVKKAKVEGKVEGKVEAKAEVDGKVEAKAEAKGEERKL